MHTTLINGIEGDFYAAHRTLSQLYNGTNYLFRRDGEMTTVLSSEVPTGDLDSGTMFATIPVRPLTRGERFPAQLRVNVSQHVDTKYRALPPEAVPAWVAQRAKGFVLSDIVVSNERHVTGIKIRDDRVDVICLQSYDVYGMYTVEDVEVATATWLRGIGRGGRRFGFGLLLPMR